MRSVRSRLGVALVAAVLAVVATACLGVSTAELPTLQVGVPASITMQASGVQGQASWTATGLPAGLAMSPAGVIAGTPEEAGTFDVTVEVTDSEGGGKAARPFSLVVDDGPVTGSLRVVAAGTGDGMVPSVSGDGRYVAFASHAWDLVPGDDNGEGTDVFVWDRTSGATTRVTGAYGGHAPVISVDGRHVAYLSRAAGEPNGKIDVFSWDRTTGVTTRVTAGNTDSRAPAISADGRFVAFNSFASNLTPGDTFGTADVYVWDRTTGAIARVTDGDRSTLTDPAISADGRHVAFSSMATNLVAGDTNGHEDVFTWDRETGTTTRITDGDGYALDPAISADGRHVAFASWASDLPGGNPDRFGEVLSWDRVTGTTTRITDGADGESRAPALSADGGQVTFSSGASDLTPGDTNGLQDVFLWDRATGTTTAITGASGFSREPAISADGRSIAFASKAVELVPGDDRGYVDVLLWQRAD